MFDKLSQIGRFIGNTPLVSLNHDRIHLFTKLEYNNFMGSIKARPAYHILKSLIQRGEIDQNTTIIESTSGNFGIALAGMCKILGIKFIPVIDPNINPTYESMLNSVAWKVEKVTTRDETGGYLLSRISRVKQLCSDIQNSIWTNQYGNMDNLRAHYIGLGEELANSFDKLDYVFIGVSSCGTISGVSRRLKEKYPNVKIVAVDSEGSVIFGQPPRKRFIPGIGASMVPTLLQEAIIDEVVHVPERQAIEGCYQLFEQHGIFAGGSSGSSYYAIQQYFAKKTLEDKPHVVFICPDNGLPYVDTIYNSAWVHKVF